MSNASKGLAKALGRSASGDVIALAELSADDLLSSMSDETKAELAAKLSAENPPAPAAPSARGQDPESDPNENEPDGDPDDAPDPKNKEKTGNDGNMTQDRVKVVASAVENDDACKGKAALALAMLADDDFASLNGAAMVKMIGKTPVEGASADADEGARADMRAALAAQGNSGIDPNGGKPAGKDPNASAAVWDQAIALNNPSQAKAG